MKKAISLLLLVVCICGMMGCEKASGPEVEINYGNSSIYSKEEMDEAIEIIKEAFTAWEGCELQSISYSSDDECSSENIAWLNDLMAVSYTHLDVYKRQEVLGSYHRTRQS